MVRPPIFSYLLLKLAARCNLDCTYCYWFRDSSVYERPKTLTPDAQEALLAKLEDHVRTYRLASFSILFHGGEPLLFGKRRFLELVDQLRMVERRTGCRLDLTITTNGVLIDEEWAAIFRTFRVGPTISIDGPGEIHDTRRVDRRGRGSYDDVVRGLTTLRRHGIEPGILAVCDPGADVEAVTRHFVEDLALRHFDILAPDATHDDAPPSIASYYKKLFDLWYEDYSRKGVEIRYVRALLKGVLGGSTHLESIGYGPIQTCAVLTGGELEPLDVLRIAGYRSTETTMRIQTHTFQDVTEDPVWRNAFDASLELSAECRACDYRLACGGGFLPHRWSDARGYDNPSVYCGDLKELFGYVRQRAAPDLLATAERADFALPEETRRAFSSLATDVPQAHQPVSAETTS